MTGGVAFLVGIYIIKCSIKLANPGHNDNIYMSMYSYIEKEIGCLG